MESLLPNQDSDQRLLLPLFALLSTYFVYYEKNNNYYYIGYKVWDLLLIIIINNNHSLKALHCTCQLGNSVVLWFCNVSGTPYSSMKQQKSLIFDLFLLGPYMEILEQPKQVSKLHMYIR